jgi:hypothetical protein
LKTNKAIADVEQHRLSELVASGSDEFVQQQEIREFMSAARTIEKYVEREVRKAEEMRTSTTISVRRRRSPSEVRRSPRRTSITETTPITLTRSTRHRNIVGVL